MVNGMIPDATRGISTGMKCFIALLRESDLSWLRTLRAAMYRANMYRRWIREFGVHGLWRLLRADSCCSGIFIRLRSKICGAIICRDCPEDFAAINTVLCFGAYTLPVVRERFESVLDLGANIGIATRYFLPWIQVLVFSRLSQVLRTVMYLG